MGLSPYITKLLKDPSCAPLTKEREAELADILQAAREAREAGVKSPRLERAEEQAKEELVRRSIRLVVTIAQSYRHRIEIDDLVGAGNVALVRAVAVWNPAIGPLAPWTIRWVRTAMTRLIDTTRTIRLPEDVAYQGAIIANTRSHLESVLNRQPTTAEIAQELDMTVESVERIQAVPEVSQTLDMPVDYDNATLGESLPSTDNVEAAIAVQDLKRRIIEACAELTTMEARIIIARFDLADTGNRPTLAEIGDDLGFSREMVRKLEASALAKLRHPALKIDLEGLID